MKNKEELLLDIRRYLLHTLHYRENEAERVLQQINRMDEKVLSWLAQWREEGTYPDEQVENVTVQELVDNLSMEPVNAFIAVDWLTKQPEEAKYALMRPWHGLEIPQELLQAMAEQDP